MNALVLAKVALAEAKDELAAANLSFRAAVSSGSLDAIGESHRARTAARRAVEEMTKAVDDLEVHAAKAAGVDIERAFRASEEPS